MPAEVTGAFVLEGARAAGSARRLTGELRELDSDAGRAGEHLDGVVSRHALRELRQPVGALGGDVRTGADALRELERDTGRAHGSVGRLGERTRVLGATLTALDTVVRVIRWPALIAGAGGATQAVAGLAAGAVALTPRLADAAGAVVGLVPLYTGLAGAVATTALAVDGLSEAAAGDRDALRRLTPEARAFLGVVRDARGDIRTLRRSSQRELFPSLERSLGLLERHREVLRGIVRQQARDVAGLARFGAGETTRPRTVRDLVGVGDQSGRAFGDAARGGVLFAEALTHAARAAEPFTDWLGTSIYRLGVMAEREAELGRETGALEAYFARTQTALEGMARTGTGTLGAVIGVMRAASADGDGIWRAVEDGADRWARWAQSPRGQLEMRRYLADLRPVLRESTGLVGDVVSAVGEIARGPEAAVMLRELRAIVPDAAAAASNLTTDFGPALVDTLGDVAGLLAELSEHAGALTVFVDALGDVAAAAEAAADGVGGLGDLLVGGAALAFLAPPFVTRRAARTVEQHTGRGTLLAEVAAGAAAGRAVTAARAQGTRGLAAGVAAAPAAARAAWRRVRTRPAAPGRVFRTAGTVVRPEVARTLPGAAWSKATPGALRLGGGAGRFLLGAVGGRAGLLIMFGIGAAATKGGFGPRLQGGLSMATFGIIPPMVTPEIARGRGQQRAAEVIADLPAGGTEAQQRHAIGDLRGEMDTLKARLHSPKVTGFEQVLGGSDATIFGLVKTGKGTTDVEREEIRATTKELEKELKLRQRLLTDTVRQRGRELDRLSITHAAEFSGDLAGAFRIRARHEGLLGAMDDTAAATLQRMRGIRPAGAKALGENVLAWTRQYARGHPRALKEVRELERDIERHFRRTGRHVTIVHGRILTGTEREWRTIRLALTTQTELARQESKTDFTSIQKQAVGSLKGMGFSPREARALVRQAEKGGKTGQATLQTVTGLAHGTPGEQQAAQNIADMAEQGALPGDRPRGDGAGDGPGHTALPARPPRMPRLIGAALTLDRIGTVPRFEPGASPAAAVTPAHRGDPTPPVGPPRADDTRRLAFLAMDTAGPGGITVDVPIWASPPAPPRTSRASSAPGPWARPTNPTATTVDVDDAPPRPYDTHSRPPAPRSVNGAAAARPAVSPRPPHESGRARLRIPTPPAAHATGAPGPSVAPTISYGTLRVDGQRGLREALERIAADLRRELAIARDWLGACGHPQTSSAATTAHTSPSRRGIRHLRPLAADAGCSSGFSQNATSECSHTDLGSDWGSKRRRGSAFLRAGHGPMARRGTS